MINNMTDKNKIAFYMKQINDFVINNGNEFLKSCGLTISQLQVLTYITEAEGRGVAQKDIEKFFNISHPTVTGLMKRLKSKGFITITPTPHDRRSNRITATEKCDDMLTRMRTGRQYIEYILTRALSSEQVSEFANILTLIYNDLYGVSSS